MNAWEERCQAALKALGEQVDSERNPVLSLLEYALIKGWLRDEVHLGREDEFLQELRELGDEEALKLLRVKEDGDLMKGRVLKEQPEDLAAVVAEKWAWVVLAQEEWVKG